MTDHHADPGPDRRRQPTLIDPARAVTDGVAGSSSDDRSQIPTGGEVLADRYELRRILGTGATSQVWSAHDRLLDRMVAVKQLLPEWRLHPEVAERFRREALVTARLHHPAIVGVLDAGEDASGVGFQVLELVEGDSLADHLRAAAPLPPAEVIDLGTTLLGALAHAHAAGLVHRDVKPGNVLLDRRHGGSRPLPRLTDFGVAKALAPAADLTAAGVVIGTANYLSPEQATGADVDQRADLYSLGCVLFEALTGELPFTGANALQAASARIGVQVRPTDRLLDVPVALDDVIARAMAPDREARWPDADAMAAALERVREDLAGARPAVVPVLADEEESRPVATVRPSTDPSRRIVLVGVVGVLLLVAVVLGVAGLGDGSPDQAATSPTEPAAGGGGQLQPVAAVEPFDPQGDGGEHAEDLPLVLDGDAATAWTTEGYNSANFGNLKDGVGFLIDLGEVRDVGVVRLLGTAARQRVEVHAAADRPADLAAARLVGTAEGGGDVEMDLDGAEGVRYLVVWIVPPLPGDGGRFRGSVGEVQLQ